MHRDFQAGGPPLASRSDRPKMLVALIGIALAAVTTGIVWLMTASSNIEVIGVVGSVEEAAVAPASPRFERFLNTVGGYSFSYPRHWKARGHDSTTRLFPRDRRVLMSFGRAPAGSLRSSSRALLAEVAASYTDAGVREDAQLETIHGRRALVVAGEGTNDSGVSLNFLVVTIHGAEGNYGITVFTEAGSDPPKILPPVQRVISSFKIL